jgi:hypothetical protein
MRSAGPFSVFSMGFTCKKSWANGCVSQWKTPKKGLGESRKSEGLENSYAEAVILRKLTVVTSWLVSDLM